MHGGLRSIALFLEVLAHEFDMSCFPNYIRCMALPAIHISLCCRCYPAYPDFVYFIRVTVLTHWQFTSERRFLYFK